MGIKVISFEESLSKNTEFGYLHVSINTVAAEYIVAYCISFTLNQRVLLVRDPGIDTTASTWITGGGGWAGKGVVTETIRDEVKNRIDQFCNDYLKVNPKD